MECEGITHGLDYRSFQPVQPYFSGQGAYRLHCPRRPSLHSARLTPRRACDTLTVIRSIIDAVSLKMCPLGLEAALLLDTQRSHLCVLPISAFSLLVIVSLAFIGWAVPTGANFIIEYNWWKEVAQVDTWISMLWYSIAPAAIGSLLAFIAFYVAHARGLHFAGIRQRDYPIYSRLVPVGLALIAIWFASASIDFWTVMRFFGSRGITAPPSAWQDHVFSHPLPVLSF